MLCEFRFGSTTVTHLNQVILVLGAYFNPGNELYIKKHEMRHRMSNVHGLKVIRYAACMVEINE